MKSAALATIPRPLDEDKRLAALYRYQLLDTASEDDFNFLTELAAELCDVPYAFVSLVDKDRVWVKAAFGIEGKQTPRDETCCSWTILQDGVFTIPDATKDERTAMFPMTLGPPNFRMYAGASLVTSDGYRIGTLCVLDHVAHVLSDRQKTLLTRLSHQAMELIESHARADALQDALANGEHLSTIDARTGLLTRSALEERLELEVERVRRYKGALSVVRIALDSLKVSADGEGMAMRDTMLRNIGTAIRKKLRVLDIAGRYGDEEFCIVLPGTGAEGAAILAESLRTYIAALENRDSEHAVGITATIGVASIGDPAVPLAESKALLLAVEDSLYEARNEAQGRVEARAKSRKTRSDSA